MTAEQWQVLDTIAGTLQAEILRGFLEAQGVPAQLSQEGAGRSAFVVNVGPLGEVDILVQEKDLARAQQILDDYYSGALEDEILVDEQGDEDEQAGLNEEFE